jgi:hypothetical protein
MTIGCGGGSSDGVGPIVEPTTMPMTGTAVPELASFDRVITVLM